MALRAVHFGAGNIGRGFLGPLYFASGYATTFVDVDTALIAALNARGNYPLRIVGNTAHDEVIGNVYAMDAREVDAVAAAVAQADIVSTAVGVKVLPHIADALAQGLTARYALGARALDIIVCENLLHAGPHLRELVRAALSTALHDYLAEDIGFVEASVGRMVPVMTPEQRAADPLLVCVEPYCDLPVDAEAFKGPIPAIAHLQPKAHFGAYVERKLFVHNLSHAATAYLGYLRGHTYIWEAIADPVVYAAVDAAMRQSCAGLAKKHGLDLAELDAHRADLLHRYTNRALGDQIARVAADPVRKLGPADRLIGAARCCLDEELPADAIAFAAAAAMRYDHPGDTGAAGLQALRAGQGVAGVLREICQVDPDSPLGHLLLAADAALQQSNEFEQDHHARH
jgi:mannitol-1-phosphate 5-dehydrogenase